MYIFDQTLAAHISNDPNRLRRESPFETTAGRSSQRGLRIMFMSKTRGQLCSAPLGRAGMQAM